LSVRGGEKKNIKVFSAGGEKGGKKKGVRDGC